MRLTPPVSTALPTLYSNVIDLLFSPAPGGSATPRWLPVFPMSTQNSIKESLVTQLQKALLEAFEEPRVQAACESVFIDGIEVLPAWAYERILEMEQLAAAQDYPELG